MPNLLNASIGRFVGRERALEHLGAIVDGARLVTIVGPPGAGKTRVALRYFEGARATSSEDEFWCCDLTEACSIDEVCATVARALDLSLSSVGDARESIDRVGARLAGSARSMLLLDNCEQAIEPVAECVTHWIVQAPATRLLLTSRERLRTPYEHVFELPPMDLPAVGEDPTHAEAVQFFIERARAIRADWTPGGDEMRAVAEVVRSLDGLPLAIELVAARLPLMGVRQLAGDLQSSLRLDLASSARRGVHLRQRSLRHALQWSWLLLSEAEQSLLAQCAVFHGGWTTGAAVHVVELVEPSGDVHRAHTVDVLQGLRDKSLVYSTNTPDGSVRLAQLLSVRDFAREKLEAMGRAEDALGRHAAYFADLAVRLCARVPTRHGVEALEELTRERDNIAAAFEWAVSRRNSDEETWSLDIAFRAVAGLEPLYRTRGPLAPYLAMLDRALARLAGMPEPPPSAIRVLLSRANVHYERGTLEQARADADRALGLARGKGDRRSEGRAVFLLGQIDYYANYERALGYYRDGLAIHRETGDRSLEALALTNIAEIHLDCGDLASACAFKEEAIAVCRAEGNRRLEGRCLGRLGRILLSLGDLEGAERALEDALQRAREIDDRQYGGELIGAQGVLAHERGDIGGARIRFAEALSLIRKAGNPRLYLVAVDAGRCEHEAGVLQQAHTLYLEALEMLRRVADRRGTALCAAALAALATSEGRDRMACQLFTEARGAAAAEPDPAVRAVVEIYWGHMELSRCRAELAISRVPSARRAFDAARNCLKAAVPVAHLSVDVRLAARSLAHCIGETDQRVLFVGPRAEWFVPPGSSKKVDLRDRQPSRRLLHALASAATRAQTLSLQALVEAGWPGEKMSLRAAANRVYSAVATLRRRGLREVLQRSEHGYSLNRNLAVIVTARPTDAT
jgi:predicted ATPase